jgi:hypothetical protein
MRIHDWMEDRAHTRSLFELRPGIADVLERLRQRGLKLGLAANQPMRALEDLNRHGIGHYFANRGISAVYGFKKPDVRLFCGRARISTWTPRPASWSETASTTTSCRRSCWVCAPSC